MSNGRTVSTDALETLGTIIDASQKRDAIHLAVLPAQAGTALARGESIKIENGQAWVDHGPSPLLIVDPFLRQGVARGEWFWAVLRPRLVTSLRHVWDHPALPDEGAGIGPAKSTPRSIAEEWLRDYAANLDVGFDDLIYCAERYLREGEYMVRGGVLEGVYTSEDFWVEFGVYRGTPVPRSQRGNFFGCSC